jgi:hypothetical protein
MSLATVLSEMLTLEEIVEIDAGNLVNYLPR